VDVSAILSRQADVLTKNTEAMVSAVREEMRGLASMVVESRNSKVKVAIERDSDGRISNMIIEKLPASEKRLN
jgi:hypothetical protein